MNNEKHYSDSNQFLEVDISRRDFFKITLLSGASVTVPGLLLPRDAHAAIDPFSLLSLGLIAASATIINSLKKDLKHANNKLSTIKSERIVKSDMMALDDYHDKGYYAFDMPSKKNKNSENRYILSKKEDIFYDGDKDKKNKEPSIHDLIERSIDTNIILERDFTGMRLPHTNGILTSSLQKNESDSGLYYGINTSNIYKKDKSAEFEKYNIVFHFSQEMENFYNRGAIVLADERIMGFAFRDRHSG